MLQIGPLAASLNIAFITVLKIQNTVPVATDCFNGLESAKNLSDNEAAYYIVCKVT
jgi:hypothetical protein